MYTSTITATNINANNFTSLLVSVTFDDGAGGGFSKVYEVPATETADDLQKRIQTDLDNLNATANQLTKVQSDLISIASPDINVAPQA